MSNNDRVTKAIDNLIDALNELRDAWTEQQEAFVPKVIISDEPPLISFEEELKDMDKSEPVPSKEPEMVSAQAVPPAPKMQAPIEPVSKQASEPEGKKCANCGATGRINAKFCLKCGKPFAALEAPQPSADEKQTEAFCSNCGEKLFPGDMFCMNCGQKC